MAIDVSRRDAHRMMTLQIHQCTLHCWTAKTAKAQHFLMTINVCNDDYSVGILNNANIINNVLHVTICKGWFICSGDEATRTRQNQNHKSRAYPIQRSSTLSVCFDSVDAPTFFYLFSSPIFPLHWRRWIFSYVNVWYSSLQYDDTQANNKITNITPK